MDQRVADLLRQLKQSTSGVDWVGSRKTIIQLHSDIDSEEDRVTLLSMYVSLMDFVERHAETLVTDLETFRQVRLQDYRRMLTMEALIGNNVSPQKLFAIVKREMEAERLSETDELYQLAEAGNRFVAEPVTPEASQKRSWFLRMLGRH